jgi:hypothetical protein
MLPYLWQTIWYKCQLTIMHAGMGYETISSLFMFHVYGYVSNAAYACGRQFGIKIS